MLPVDLYRSPMFALSSLTSICSFTRPGSRLSSALPFYFQTVLGFSAVQTGLLLTPWPVMTAIAAPIAGPLSDRYPPAILGGIGLAILATGLALIAALPGHPSHPRHHLEDADLRHRLRLLSSPPTCAPSCPAHPPNAAAAPAASSPPPRLCGQAVGAALVAFCFGLSMLHGPSLALAPSPRSSPPLAARSVSPGWPPDNPPITDT